MIRVNIGYREHSSQRSKERVRFWMHVQGFAQKPNSREGEKTTENIRYPMEMGQQREAKRNEYCTEY
jgi:hypothetical protein